MRRKVFAVLLVLGVILCRMPQAAVAAENIMPEAEEAGAVIEAEEASADIQETDVQAAENDMAVTVQDVFEIDEEYNDYPEAPETEQAAVVLASDSGNEFLPAAESENNTGETEVDAVSTAAYEEEPETSPIRVLSEDPDSDISAAPADTAESPVRSAGGQYAINIYYNSSRGSVTAKVDDTAAASADGGDLVYLIITPYAGYEFQSAGVAVMNSDGESVRTVPQADGSISFQMPNSSATVAVLFTIAEDAEPTAPTAVDTVSLFVDQPAAGETTDTEDPAVTALDWMYEVTEASWADSSGNALSAPLTFESDATYYIAATVISYWESDAAYFFPQEGLTVEIENGSLVGIPNITNIYDAGSTMQILIAVQPAVKRSADQIQVWVGSIDGNTTMAQSGGMTAASYTPSEPNIYDFGKYGEYTVGDIVRFYPGDEITVMAQAEEGYRFVGWYRVNIDYNMSGGDTDYSGVLPNKAYSGSVISTAASFTYRPGETILPGDTEPLRYICAVFEEAAPKHNANEIQVWIGDVSGNEPLDGYTGGKVAVLYTPSYDDYPEDVTAKDGTVYEHGAIFGCYEGDEVTLTAKADAGYRFTGWYLADGEWPQNGPEKYTGDMLSDQTSYTFEFTGMNRLICAVFEEDAVESYTVSFDPGTGTGIMDPVTVDAGTEYELPPCTFTHTNSKRTFYRWSVDGELMDPGDTITVSRDTEVIAKWLNTERTGIIDNSVDRSTTEVAGTLKLTDVQTGEVMEVVAFDEVTSSAFTQPSNPTVEAMIREAKESAAAKASEMAGGNDVTIVSESVSDPFIVRTIDNRTYTYFVDVGSDGDYAMFLIVDGDWAHLWNYDVTVEAEYISSVEVTLHWSSADGVDLMEPVVIEADPGMRLDDALTAAGMPYVDLFSREGYEDFGYRCLHPVDSFADEDAFYDDCISGDYIIRGDTDIYVVMFRRLDAAEISIAEPLCGSTGAPAVAIAADEYSFDRDPLWITDADSHEPYTDMLVGGNEYLAEVWLTADFRFFIADDAQISVNGGELISSEVTPDDRIDLIVKVIAEHDPAEPLTENVIEPACTASGSHDEVVYCSVCGEEISRTEVIDPALGHDWGAWEITREPTETEEGEEMRTCTRCGETEIRTIPHVAVEYRSTGGDGSSWEKGSSEALVFVFARSINDETALSHFTEIQVDGKTVDASNYTAVSGSVVITLKPEFLQTLSVGKHSLTAVFDDADAVTVSFSVTEKAAPPADDHTEKANVPNTGDSRNIFAWMILFNVSFLNTVFLMLQKRKSRLF